MGLWRADLGAVIISWRTSRVAAMSFYTTTMLDRACAPIGGCTRGGGTDGKGGGSFFKYWFFFFGG